MRHVSASEAKQRLGAVLDAAQREPVVIRRRSRAAEAAARGLDEGLLARPLADDTPPER